MMNPQEKRKRFRIQKEDDDESTRQRGILLHIRASIFLSHPAWRLLINMNIEQEESKKKLYRSKNYLSSSLKY
jgi:hypothetical protein